jgi:hypothetical protein
MVSIEFYSVHGGFPVDPEHIDLDAVVQKHKTGMPIKIAANTLGSPCRCFGVDKYALFCYICAGLETKGQTSTKTNFRTIRRRSWEKSLQ